MDMLRVFSLFLCLISSVVLSSQTLSPAPQRDDSQAFLSSARRVNGLDSDNVQPWHVRGTYKLFNKDGKVDDTGVYEEWWWSDINYKRSYTSSKFTQVEYAISKGLFRDGSQDWLGADTMMLRSSLIQPLLKEDELKG